MLATEVERFLEERPQFLDQLAAAPTLNPASVPTVQHDLSQIIVDPPEKIVAPTRSDKPWLSRKGQNDIPDQYHLFRVFNMGKGPQLYILHGSLKGLCQLEPVLFRAVI